MTHTSVSSGYRKSSCCTRDSFFSLQVHNIHNVYLNMIWKTSYYLPHRKRYPTRTIYNLVAPNNSEPEMILLLYDILQHHRVSSVRFSLHLVSLRTQKWFNKFSCARWISEHPVCTWWYTSYYLVGLNRLVQKWSCLDKISWTCKSSRSVLSWKYTFYLVWPNYYTHRNDLVRTNDLI